MVTFHDALMLKRGARELPADAYPRLTMLGQRLNLRAATRAERIIVDSQSGRREFLRYSNQSAPGSYPRGTLII